MKRIDVEMLDKATTDKTKAYTVLIIRTINEVNKLSDQIAEARLGGYLADKRKPALRDRMLMDVIETIDEFNLKASSIGRGFVREMPDRSNHEECLDMADEILAAYQEIAAVRQTERKKAAVSR